MTLSAGSRLGPYEIVAPIGAGGGRVPDAGQATPITILTHWTRKLRR